jgi:DNA-binding CsgD family transcriptional regulator
VGVVRGTGARDTCALETAARREDGSIDVTVRLLTDDVLGELFHARADVMATRAGLSEREREVFDLILLGRTAVETSGVLGISPRTVKFHQANVMAKLGADSRADLLRLML